MSYYFAYSQFFPDQQSLERLFFEIACKITQFRKYNEKYLLFSYDSCIFAVLN